ncbi:glycosyltransferase [Catalinimonas niigatensis]|uniref:glycosyltransferase n=1 Tax=Catalinimonas niigatensis TaxID=1397264 RepID=UPI00266523B6|nr:glycosyltransferase [Catalinimonas niigatensis]WPP50494.1 glycosyltransferase [Catalinimonas niigatensis]
MEARKPILSIVICTYNREEFIDKTLHHLSKQSLPYADFEAIIVNNNSTDNTENICQEFIQKHPEMQIKYYLEKQQGHSYARNRGIKESSGEYIAYIDDDAFVYPDFGSNIIRFFGEHPDVIAIGGKIIPVYQNGKPRWMSHYLLPLVSALDMGKTTKPFQGRKFPVGANVTFRKAVFDRYGMFNVKLGRIGSGLMGGDEKEMIYRMKKNNESIYYVPDVVVEHVIPPKRLEMDYIRGLAEGVGKSEKNRLRGESIFSKLSRALEELIKIGGTLILFLLYTFKGQFAQGWMLIKFRYWVMMGFLKK